MDLICPTYNTSGKISCGNGAINNDRESGIVDTTQSNPNQNTTTFTYIT